MLTVSGVLQQFSNTIDLGYMPKNLQAPLALAVINFLSGQSAPPQILTNTVIEQGCAIPARFSAPGARGFVFASGVGSSRTNQHNLSWGDTERHQRNLRPLLARRFLELLTETLDATRMAFLQRWDGILFTITTMGIASLPCSGYFQIGAPSPDKRRAAGCTQNLEPPATTKTTQVNARSANRNSRHADTTSTVARARSGWSSFKFSDFTIRLPGPIGRRS
ncbi:hypothetical protein EDB83DRAFT_2312315 [Lactarius deliciosus]|nr:hypothetical protein EDB83DRAFT_2312315 [Lactarius deliciosus]